MPHAALKPCSYPGCPELVKSGRCDQHKQPDVYHDRDSQRLYNTARWGRLRHRQLSREPWCAECLKQGYYEPATDVDHVEPHKGDPIKFYEGALQSLCHACHSRKTANEVFHA